MLQQSCDDFFKLQNNTQNVRSLPPKRDGASRTGLREGPQEDMQVNKQGRISRKGTKATARERE